MWLCEDQKIYVMRETRKTPYFRHDVVPIFMGVRPEDYFVSAPYKSYIHVDDSYGLKDLQEALTA